MASLTQNLVDEVAGKLDGVDAAATPAEAARQIEQLRKALAGLEKRVGARARETGLETFFGEVSRGMIEAQRTLDSQSVQYSLGAAEQAMPAMFRIPRVSAEFQFGIESSASRGFNVLLLSSEKSQKETIQHKVSFEVVAVPPPPEVVAQIAARPAPLDAVTAMLANRLRQVAEDEQTTESETEIARTLGDEIASAMQLRSLGGMLVLLRRDEGGEAQLYLAFLPDAGKVSVARVPRSAFSKGLQNLVDAVSEAARAARPPTPEKG